MLALAQKSRASLLPAVTTPGGKITLMKIVVESQFFARDNPQLARKQRYCRLTSNNPPFHAAIRLARMIDKTSDRTATGGVEGEILVEINHVDALRTARSDSFEGSSNNTDLVGSVCRIASMSRLLASHNVSSVLNNDLITLECLLSSQAVAFVSSLVNLDACVKSRLHMSSQCRKGSISAVFLESTVVIVAFVLHDAVETFRSAFILE
jgi:hypothetical protein